MKIRNSLIITLLASGSVLLASSALADEPTVVSQQTDRLNIDYVDAEGYTDIRPSNLGSRSKFRNQVLNTMTEYFDEFAQELPEGQTLKVTVTDIDLAGDTRSARIPIGSPLQDVRVMEDIFFPRIKFSYELQDASGSVLKSEEVSLKDMAYLDRAGFVRTNRDAFAYERQMLKEWFERDLMGENS
ncbi:DUF3016 domain-containing protein [Ningiella sp. W23]|uniref:DUF3016 domain-containing protein n=1 Tax=Ningiella sp. W23 TaxID=3023715 RepID=UPI003756FF34